MGRRQRAGIPPAVQRHQRGRRRLIVAQVGKLITAGRIALGKVGRGVRIRAAAEGASLVLDSRVGEHRPQHRQITQSRRITAVQGSQKRRNEKDQTARQKQQPRQQPAARHRTLQPADL